MFYFRVSVSSHVISEDVEPCGPCTFHVLSTAKTLDDAVLHVVSGLFVENGAVTKIEACREVTRADAALKQLFSADHFAQAKTDGFVVLAAPHEAAVAGAR